MSRWVLPVPESPSSTTGSPASIQAPLASVASVAGGDGGHGVGVEVGESFERGELRFGDAAGAAAVAAFVDLGGEHLGEESRGG